MSAMDYDSDAPDNNVIAPPYGNNKVYRLRWIQNYDQLTYEMLDLIKRRELIYVWRVVALLHPRVVSRRHKEILTFELLANRVPFREQFNRAPAYFTKMYTRLLAKKLTWLESQCGENTLNPPALAQATRDSMNFARDRVHELSEQESSEVHTAGNARLEPTAAGDSVPGLNIGMGALSMGDTQRNEDSFADKPVTQTDHVDDDRFGTEHLGSEVDMVDGVRKPVDVGYPQGGFHDTGATQTGFAKGGINLNGPNHHQEGGQVPHTCDCVEGSTNLLGPTGVTGTEEWNQNHHEPSYSPEKTAIGYATDDYLTDDGTSHGNVPGAYPEVPEVPRAGLPVYHAQSVESTPAIGDTMQIEPVIHSPCVGSKRRRSQLKSDTEEEADSKDSVPPAKRRRCRVHSAAEQEGEVQGRTTTPRRSARRMMPLPKRLKQLNKTWST
ncbi:MAG: hypothetical protein Q9205_000881 [Flavoplaca limonia]